MFEAICDELVHQRLILLVGDALKCADPDMAMIQSGHHRRPRRRGFVAARQFLAGFDNRKCLRSVDAERLEHFGRQNFADRTLQGQPAIAGPAPRRRPRTLGPQIHESFLMIAQLREQKTPAIADFGIIIAELMAVITQRQRRIEIVGERFEPAEMG